MSKKHSFFFDEVSGLEQELGGKEGVINLVGDKAVNLAMISNVEIPVPKGFVISAEICGEYYAQDPPSFPPEIWDDVVSSLHKLEELTSKKLGDAESPLIISVRPSPRVLMPGIMVSILNIGLNDETCQALLNSTQNPRFVWNSYRKLLQSFSSVVYGIDSDVFTKAFNEYGDQKEYKSLDEWTEEDLEAITKNFKTIIETEHGSPFPQDPFEQIREAVSAVFTSWKSPKCVEYCQELGIPDESGVAVVLMQMIFGNMNENSAIGSAITRDPTTGEAQMSGDFLINSQGEGNVGEVQEPFPISSLQEKLPKAFEQFEGIVKKLEAKFKDSQEIKFVVEDENLWVLQARSVSKTASSLLKIACHLFSEGMITKEDVIESVTQEDVKKMLAPHFGEDDLKQAEEKRLSTGVSASPGCAVGAVYFDNQKAKEHAALGEDVILVKQSTTSDDFEGMISSKGLVAVEDETMSNGAILARQLGIPAVVGCSDIQIDMSALTMSVNDLVVKEGEFISVNGDSGQIFIGQIPLNVPELNEQKDLLQVLSWADEIRSSSDARESINSGPTRGLKILAEVHTADDANKARANGAEGIGLCCSDRMLVNDKKALVEKILLEESDSKRNAPLKKLAELQAGEFSAIFEAMSELPVVIRLFDPSLSEFLPDINQLTEEVNVLLTKKELGIEINEEELTSKEKILKRLEELSEANPAVGSRGIRLCFTIPGLLKMQVRSIIEGALMAAERGAKPIPIIMFPFVCNENEIVRAKPDLERAKKRVFKEKGTNIDIDIGCMIEVPRSAVIADKIAEHVNYITIGMEEIHQMGMGLSKKNSESKFLQRYHQLGIIDDSVFQSVDVGGMGKLMKMCAENGRSNKGKVPVIGVNSERVYDTKTVDFCHNIGIDYISCPPEGIIFARLSAAQACIHAKRSKTE